VSERRYLDTRQVASRYNTTPAVIREWVRRGRIPFRRLPGRKAILFLGNDLDAYDDGAVELERHRLRGGGVVVRPRPPA
jgi:Helix-turn-helix domain